MCFERPRFPIQRHSYMRKHGKVAAKWREVRLDWVQKHPGPWQCYICGVPLDIEAHDAFQRLTLDHVLPRSTHPELRWDHDNLEPACWDCNHKKGSMDATAKASKRAYHKKLDELQA